MTVIGIPRAMLYYKYFPMWHTFLKELGVEIVISENTNMKTVARGSAHVITDTCLPVKVYMGHVTDLAGKCDYVLIPVLRSIKRKVLNCSLFLALPDLTKAVAPKAPPILEIEFDANRGQRFLYHQIYSLGRNFTLNPLRIRRAALKAWQTHLKYQDIMVQQKITPQEAITALTGIGKDETVPKTTTTSNLSIAVIGHAYMLYDEEVNHNLMKRLRKQKVNILTPEMLTQQQITAGMNSLVKDHYWTAEEEVIGAGGYYLDSGVDGVIAAMAFGCGPDSLMMSLVQRYAAKKTNTPFMCITLEEHTAEAGIVTRLEAFVDMISRKNLEADKLCA